MLKTQYAFVVVATALAFPSGVPACATGELHWPPAEIVKALDSPPLPLVVPDPARRLMLIVERASLPSREELAERALVVDGLRINPRTFSRTGPRRYTGISLVDVESEERTVLALPDRPNLGFPVWSPDGGRFGFTITTGAGVELWVADSRAGHTRRLVGPVLNATLGSPFVWMPDGQRILYREIPSDLRRRTSPPPVSSNPRIRDSRATPPVGRARGEESVSPLAEDYRSAQLKLIDVRTELSRPIAAPGVFERVEPSPDGTVLLVARRTAGTSNGESTPTSATSVELWDIHGQTLRQLALNTAPRRGRWSADAIQPRGFGWRPAAPATVVWYETESGANGNVNETGEDRLMQLEPPYVGAAKVIARLAKPISRVDWLPGFESALLTEYDRDMGIARTWLAELGQASNTKRMAWEHRVGHGNSEEIVFLTPRAASDAGSVTKRDTAVYLKGSVREEGGNLAYVDELQLATLTRERRWQSSLVGAEKVIAVLPGKGPSLWLIREGDSNGSGVYTRDLATGVERRVVEFGTRKDSIVALKARPITYFRADGVPLSAKLYLPPDFEPGRPLPLIISGYPHNSPAIASRGTPSTVRSAITDIRRSPHLLLAMRGYVVMDRAAIPVIGNPAIANDTFIRQVVMGVEAAIETAVSLGIADRERVGIIGHSYGAFMVANLLARSDLFRAGVAMSGAYNRTLTPFGFQTERRSLWEARDTYLEISPFLFADRIRAPLLLIHGALDDNPATPPQQAEMMFEAIEAHGGRARLVLLPYEGHTYRAKESLLQTVREIADWFDAHVKGADCG